MAQADTLNGPIGATLRKTGWQLPPHVYFVGSAIFHYLGPAFAVLLFARIEPLGVAWLRIASAALVFAVWRRPWHFVGRLDRAERWTIVGLGAVLALMNSTFYLALARLPLGTVGAIEFLGPIGLALAGLRSRRNWLALLFAVGGVYALTNISITREPLGLICAFANCGLFILYVVLGHRLASSAGVASIDRLALSMLVAMAVALPIGIAQALPAFSAPILLGAGAGVGICSSVIPYVCDQLAMARLPRATFALMLAILPAMATVIGIIVLRQLPGGIELVGIGLVVAGVALHRAETP